MKIITKIIIISLFCLYFSPNFASFIPGTKIEPVPLITPDPMLGSDTPDLSRPEKGFFSSLAIGAEDVGSETIHGTSFGLNKIGVHVLDPAASYAQSSLELHEYYALDKLAYYTAKIVVLIIIIFSIFSIF